MKEARESDVAAEDRAQAGGRQGPVHRDPRLRRLRPADQDAVTALPVSTVIDTVLLKVASRCNLDCNYCYVYHMGDNGWRAQPKRMPATVRRATVRQLADLYAHQRQPFSVVLHGGEPLLLGADGLRDFCNRLRSALPAPCGVHVQTNGVLLTEEIIDIFVRFDVGISVSIDGPRDLHDRFRLDFRGRGSHDRVLEAIGRLTARSDALPLFAGVLAVVDPGSNPGSVYASLKATGAPSLDFLIRDGNHARLPPGKVSRDSTEYGLWMVGLLDVYLRDPEPPRVRILDDMLRIILGGQARKEGVGVNDYGILTIETDGRINKNDTLKVAHPGADRFERSWSILSDSLLDVVHSQSYADYYRQQRPTALACRACPELHVCGGGMAAHRWSDDRGFDNPSVFCADQLLLIRRMREWVVRRPATRKAKGDSLGQHERFPRDLEAPVSGELQV